MPAQINDDREQQARIESSGIEKIPSAMQLPLVEEALNVSAFLDRWLILRIQQFCLDAKPEKSRREHFQVLI